MRESGLSRKSVICPIWGSNRKKNREPVTVPCFGFLFAERFFTLSDADGVGLLDVPLVEAGKAHGDVLPPEKHPAFDQRFGAGMEGSGPREAAAEGTDPGTVDTGADEDFRSALSIPEPEELADGIHAFFAV